MTADAVKIRSGQVFRIFTVPLFLLWIVFPPLLLLLSPLVLIACVFAEVNPFRIFTIMWQMTDALAGAEFEIHRGRRTIVVRISGGF